MVGAANNQLLESRHGDEFAVRNILYVPDYAANWRCDQWLQGTTRLEFRKAEAKVDEIYDTILNLLHIAANEGVATYRVADSLAKERLKNGV